MRNTLLYLILFLWFGTIQANAVGQETNRMDQSQNTDYGEGKIVVCGSNRVYIINLKTSTSLNPDIEWQWIAADATDLPAKYRESYFNEMDECKPSADGTKLFVTSSSGGIAVINIADKKVMFYARSPSVHSIEELPNNKIAAISSTNTSGTGNSIEIFDLSESEKSLYKTDFYSGHGLFWHKSKQVLFALGGSELRIYSLKNWKTTQPSLHLIKTKIQPGTSGHDLQSVADSTSLIITDKNNCFLYDIKAAKFSGIYKPLANKIRVKSVSVNKKNGSILYVKPEKSWWAYHVWFLLPERMLPIPNMNVYKARWINTN